VDEKSFTLRSGAYVVHEVLIRRMPGGDFSCAVEFEVGRMVQRRVLVLIRMDAAPVVSEVWSIPDAQPYWYGFATERAFVDRLTELALSI
jgi:hypothetical protein